MAAYANELGGSHRQRCRWWTIDVIKLGKADQLPQTPPLNALMYIGTESVHSRSCQLLLETHARLKTVLCLSVMAGVSTVGDVNHTRASKSWGSQHTQDSSHCILAGSDFPQEGSKRGQNDDCFASCMLCTRTRACGPHDNAL